MDSKLEAEIRINTAKIAKSGFDRLSERTKEIMKAKYVFDVHSHLFDIQCINKSYFIIRFIKDFLGLKSGGDYTIEFSVEEAYKEISENNQGWEIELINKLNSDSDIKFKNKHESTKGFLDIVEATKFLTFNKMSDVYNHYIKNYSLASILGIENQHIISTALTMDLESGWNVKIKKSLYEQISELKELSIDKPVLPFLYCDPRRAEIEDSKNNLYSLFNYAFCEGQSFFGVKIYPALGYSPSDYRLWPIYEICEKYSIPVLTHCGGESISTDMLFLEIYEGHVKTSVSVENRKEIAYNLNNPQRWELVLQKFPKLKLNFGHFGGYETWESSSIVMDENDPQHRKENIYKLMNKYQNVYADFAFNFVEDKLAENLINVLIFNETVRNRLMFGTDYWMVTPKGNLRNEQFDFIKRLSDNSNEFFNLMTLSMVDNPKKYLFD